jgi:serine/threonine protein kinase
MVGSLWHMSPEQIQGKCYSGEKVDIWALGVILYRMLTGRPPFNAATGQEFVNSILKAKYDVKGLSAGSKLKKKKKKRK